MSTLGSEPTPRLLQHADTCEFESQLSQTYLRPTGRREVLTFSAAELGPLMADPAGAPVELVEAGSATYEITVVELEPSVA